MNASLIKDSHVGHRGARVDLVTAVDAIGLKPIIEQTYACPQLPEALVHLARGPFGRLVVTL